MGKNKRQSVQLKEYTHIKLPPSLTENKIKTANKNYQK